MKTFLEFMTEQSAADEGRNQVQRKRLEIQKQIETGFDKVNKDLNKMNFPPMPAADGTSRITPKDNVDFTGSRYDLGNGQTVDPSKVTNKINPQREIKLRKDYRSPPAGYPDSIKDRLAAAEAGNEPPMPGSGPYKTKQSDPLKTPPAVPVEPTKPPKPKLRPERPSRKDSNDVIPSGPGITTPGSMTYTEPKPKKQITDRVPQQKMQDRVPSSAVNPKSTSFGPYAPAKSDDPFNKRYAKVASYLGQVSRTRKSETEPKALDNTKQAVPIPKPKSMDLNFTSKNKKQDVAQELTFKQMFAQTPEGQEFTWNKKRYKRITKK
jgi:hypothetical protein